MKLRLAFLIATALSILPLAIYQSAAQNSTDKSLAAYQGKNRVLLVFAPSEKDAAYQEQMKLWQAEKAGFTDRQLVVLPVLAEGKPSTGDAPGDLEKRYGADAKSFKVVLIGKDGHDAYSSAKPVAPENLYRRIDAMPMRRDEMKRQAKKP